MASVFFSKLGGVLSKVSGLQRQMSISVPSLCERALSVSSS